MGLSARDIARDEHLTPRACLRAMRLCHTPEYRAAWLQTAHEVYQGQRMVVR